LSFSYFPFISPTGWLAAGCQHRLLFRQKGKFMRPLWRDMDPSHCLEQTESFAAHRPALEQQPCLVLRASTMSAI
jgi:hypothetical protein